MKRNLIITIICAALPLCGIAQMSSPKRVVQRLLPSVSQQIAPLPFTFAPKYVKMGSSVPKIQAEYEALSYFDPDMLTNGNLLFYPIPAEFPDGSISTGLGQRFTPKGLADFTVDSFFVIFTLNEFEERIGNKLRFTLYRRENFPSNPNLFPDNHWVDSVDFTPSDLPSSDTAYQMTIGFSRVNQPHFYSGSPDFWIFLEMPSLTGNYFQLIGDATTDDPANHGNPLPEGDRSYMFYTRNDSTFVTYLGGVFQNQNNAYLYPQLHIVAFASGIPLGASNEELTGTMLGSVYPNPVSSEATMHYSLAESGMVSIEVYDVLGNHQATVAREYQQAGAHTVSFSANELSNGAYLCILRIGNDVVSKRIIVSK